MNDLSQIASAPRRVVDSDVSRVPVMPEKKAADWEALITEADSGINTVDFSLGNEGPLSLVGLDLPTDKLDFMWVRAFLPDWRPDAQNIQGATKKGWRPVPADLVAGVVDSDPSLAAAGMDGGVGRGKLVLYYRSKSVSDKERKAKSAIAAGRIDNILSQYDVATTRGNLLTSQAPFAERGLRQREYRQAAPQEDDV